MSAKSFKVTFTLDEKDASYFHALFRKSKSAAKTESRESILKAAQELVKSVRSNKKTPQFVLDAAQSLEDLTKIIEDHDYAAPKPVQSEVMGALAYFANPDDLIPDDIPVLGFLDDAIMIKFVEEEFKHELWGYRKFKKFKAGAEQRPWTQVASSRLPERLSVQRKKIREQIEAKKHADAAKGKKPF